MDADALEQAVADDPVAARLAADETRVHRFSISERALHAVNLAGFMVMLASGLVLYLPALSAVFANRPVVKAVHLAAAALWLAGLLLVNVLGDRRVLGRTRRQFEALDGDDLRWLYSKAARAKPAGRFNGGQKFHAIVQAALMVLFYVSGTFILLGERDHSLRPPGAIALHDLSMFAALIFLVGHVLIAISPTGSPSLRGLADGTVPASYARRHHAEWDPASEPVEHRPPLTPARIALALAVLAAGVAGAAVLAGAG